MMRFQGFIILLLLVANQAFAAPKLQALFSHSTFMMAGKNPYIETFLVVKGNSVRYRQNEHGKFQASIEVILSLSQGDKVTFADRFNLMSPETEDTLHGFIDFQDQQRIPAPDGHYLLEISIRDNYSNNEATHAGVEAVVDFPSDSVCISDIQLIRTYEKAEKPGPFFKGGYTLLQKQTDFYSEAESRLVFYTEVYRTLQRFGPEEKYLLTWHIEDRRSKQRLENYSGFRRYSAAAVNSVLSEIDISTLHSGEYQLLLEVRDKENQLIRSRTLPFVRYNPKQAAEMEHLATVITAGSFTDGYKNPDSLAEHIRCLSPISSMTERSYADNLVKEKSMLPMQQYFLNFWKNRNPQNPQEAWEKYLVEVRKVQKEFSTKIKPGYASDRGRVYLQYGPPDNRTVSLREPSAYPYEIWHYYKLKSQSNKRFVFYNRDLVSNDFTLIHSDALGEPQNDQWMFMIMKRDTQTNDIDADSSDPHFGSQLKQNYQTPR
jgi:GWxTD domain-containing protein